MRGLFLFFALVVGFSYGSAFAAYGIWSKSGSYHGGGVVYGASPQEVGDAFCANIMWFDTSEFRNMGSANITQVDVGYAVYGTCPGEKLHAPSGVWYVGTYGTYAMGSWVSVATCPVGYTGNPSTNLCEKASPCTAGAGVVVSSGMYDLGPDANATPPTTTCDGQCELSYNGSGVVARQMIGGAFHYFSEGSYTQTAAECSTSDALEGTPGLPPTTCDAATQDAGQVNGVDVCLDKQKTTDQTDTVKTVDPATGVETETMTQQKSDGTTDTTVKTTDPATGASSSTTTNAPTPGGGGDFCRTHPTDKSCRPSDDKRWGSGGVGKGFAGQSAADAEIEAKKLAISARYQEIRTAISAKFAAPASGLAGSIPCDSVTVLGQSFRVCLSDYQSTFDTIGNALLAIAYILAALWIFM